MEPVARKQVGEPPDVGGGAPVAWSELTFGKHKGKTLPQVLFADPEYFFWAYEERVFKGGLAAEAEELAKRLESASRRTPQKNSSPSTSFTPESGSSGASSLYRSLGHHTRALRLHFAVPSST